MHEQLSIVDPPIALGGSALEHRDAQGTGAQVVVADGGDLALASGVRLDGSHDIDDGLVVEVQARDCVIDSGVGLLLKSKSAKLAEFSMAGTNMRAVGLASKWTVE